MATVIQQIKVKTKSNDWLQIKIKKRDRGKKRMKI